jgi:hypothetical protein
MDRYQAIWIVESNSKTKLYFMPQTNSAKKEYERVKQKTAHYDEYKVNKTNDPIYISVLPGDTGQAALTDVFLEGENIIKQNTGAIQDHEIGNNKTLRAKFLDVYTLITDVQGEPDLTSFRFMLRGGAMPYEYYTEKTVQVQGDSVIYKITIFFTIHRPV